MKSIVNSSIKSLALATIICSSTNGYSQSKKEITAKKVLFVVTNVNVAPSNGAAIGLWLEEFATPYYTLTDKGFSITIASPSGGVSPVDLRSSAETNSNEQTRRFLADTEAQKALYHTIALKDVDPQDYDGIFYPGGRGPMWDLPENPYSVSIIESMFAAGKPLAFVCHGPVALKNAKNQQGVLILKDRKISGFTNAEEASGKTGAGIPYLLEDMLRGLGANYQKGPDFKPFVVKDGTLISGQNPHSSLKVAEELMLSLESAPQ